MPYGAPCGGPIGAGAGVAWTPRTAPAQAWNHIAWSPALNLFCAVGNGSAQNVMTSPDGFAWTLRNTPNGISDVFTAVAWADTLGLFIATTNSGGGFPAILTSPDGINWTARATPTPAKRYGAIVWAGNPINLAIAGENNSGATAVTTSPDGINWTDRATPVNGAGASGAAFDPAGGIISLTIANGRTMRSANGTGWAQVNPPAFNSQNEITWSPQLGLFIAVASSGVGNRVMTSPDANVWTMRASAGDFAWNGVAWGTPNASLAVAVASTGAGTQVMTSPDGINWTLRLTDTSAWQSVAYAPALGRFCAVANAGSARVMTS